MKRLSTDLADYEYENDILVVSPKSGLVLDYDDMVVMLKEAVALTDGEKYYALIDTSNHLETTLEARNYYSTSEFSKYRNADAFVVTSLAIKLVVNFYLKFNKPPVLSKMFNSKAEAFEWLLEIKNNSNKNKAVLTL
jgi:hypothetical protein